MMAVVGILLALMILEEAMGMADWNPNIHMSSDNRSQVVQRLIGIWKHSYPAGKTSEQITGSSESGPSSGRAARSEAAGNGEGVSR